MRKVISCILVMVLLASAVPMAVMPTGAQGIVVPGDKEPYDKIISKDELASVIIPYMLGESGHLGLEKVREIAHIHVYYPRAITDSGDGTVTIYKPIERIVTLNSDCAEAIRAIGAKDRIVGIESATAKSKTFFPEISTLPSVGMGSSPDIAEAVLTLHPDILIAYAPGIYNPGHEALEDKLEPTVTVVRLNFYKPETLGDDVLNLGYLLDEEENAGKYLKWRDVYVDKIEDKVSTILEEKDRPKVFIDYGQSPLSIERITSASGTGNHQLCEKAGGANIAANLPPGFAPGYPLVSAEWVMNQTPDVIIGQASGYNTRGGGYETDDDGALEAYYYEIIELLAKPVDPIPAVANDSIYIIQGDVAGGLAEIVGLAYHAKWFHPELYSDLEEEDPLKDPQEIHQEYIDNFCGIDFNVREHGVFVYSP